MNALILCAVYFAVFLVVMGISYALVGIIEKCTDRKIEKVMRDDGARR